jgi:serine/threonine protein kinase
MTEVRPLLQTAIAEHYALERELGRGGWATVFLARRVHTGEFVAVKVLRPEFARFVGAERFHREIALLATMQHPNILPLVESGQAGMLPYYIMPYADGQSLRDRLVGVPQMELAEVIDVTRAIAAALDYAHARNIVHRDIKPDNVLLLAGRPVVADFGIARAIVQAGGENLSSSGLIAGTPEYMSPEQARGARDLDGRSDLYSLGCMVFEMLAGEPPFRGPSVQALIARHAHAPPPALRVLRPDVPESVERAITAALSKQPVARPDSGAAFVELFGASSG